MQMNTTIWRYLSLAKYVDLISSRKLFFPRSTFFPDKTEGKWIAHAINAANEKHLSDLAEQADELQALLEHASTPATLLREARRIRDARKTGVLCEILGYLDIFAPHLHKQHLEDTLHGWRQVLARHPEELATTRNGVRLYRESTYISPKFPLK